MPKPDIQIVIADNSKAEKCSADCGTDWSSAEAIALASQQIKERLGEKIQLKYLDLSKPANHYALELSQEIKNQNLLLPLLLVNGQPRISGLFDIRQLLDTIEVELEFEE